jgi:hypothetical protein
VWAPDPTAFALAEIARRDATAFADICRLTGTKNDEIVNAAVDRFLQLLTVTCPFEAVIGMRNRSMALVRVLCGLREQYHHKLNADWFIQPIRALRLVTTTITTNPSHQSAWNCHDVSTAVRNAIMNSTRLEIELEEALIVTALFSADGPLAETNATSEGCDPTWKSTVDLAKSSLNGGTESTLMGLDVILKAMDGEAIRIDRLLLKYNKERPTCNTPATALALTNTHQRAPPASNPARSAAPSSNPPPAATVATPATKIWSLRSGGVEYTCGGCKAKHTTTSTLKPSCQPYKPTQQTIDTHKASIADSNRSLAALPCWEKELKADHACRANNCRYNHSLTASSRNSTSTAALIVVTKSRSHGFQLDHANCERWGITWGDLSIALQTANPAMNPTAPPTHSAAANTHTATANIAVASAVVVTPAAPYVPKHPKELLQEYVDDHASVTEYIDMFEAMSANERFAVALAHHNQKNAT